MMAENSKVEWTDHTFNPWWGCVKRSPGCKNCYAETQANRFGDWWGVDSERRFFGDKHWNEPLKWNRKAEKLGVQHKVFCGSMCDVFEDRVDLKKWRTKLGDYILATPNLDWLILSKRQLTKRIANDLLWINPDYNSWQIPDNVWLGTSVENQEMADLRIPELLKMPAKVRFLSCEPLLEPIDLGLFGTISKDISPNYQLVESCINWVIVGGESGPKRRPFNPDWARSLRDQCKEASVPFFMKQIDKVKPIPDDLMIREFPA